jgi:uncharacterized protein YqeY
MKLIEQIKKDFMVAYKAKEMEKKDFIGLLKSEVTKESKDPEDAYIVSKIKSMIKNAAATDSLSESELEILNGYLPEQLSDDKLSDIISEFIKSEELSGMKDMGKVMGYLKSNYDGLYDGKLASTLVKQKLS